MKRMLIPILILWLLCGCAPERPGLVVQSYPFNPRGKTILVQHFDFNPEIANSVDKRAVAGFGESIALHIQRFLKDAGFRYPLVIGPGEQAKGDILIRGTITRVDGGDVQQRMLAESFGLGATEVKASGEIVEVATLKSILAFSFSKQSHYTWLDNEMAVRENLREVAREVATALIQMQPSTPGEIVP